MLPRLQLTGSVTPQVPRVEVAETRYWAPVKVPAKVTFAVLGPLLVTVAIKRKLPPIAAGSGTCVRVTEISAAAPTTMLAEAVFPVPPLVEVTLPVMLFLVPFVAPVTVTLNWHWLLVLIVAPDRAIPEGLVVVKVPPHTVAEAFATVSPAGKVSVKATPLSASGFAAGLVMVKVNEVVPLSGILAAPKALAMLGGASTLSVAEAVPPVPPLAEVTLPVVLFCVPAAMPVTFTAKVQEELAAMLAAERLITFVPWVAVIVPPPQEPLMPLGVETTRPAGRVSLKPTPVNVVVVLLFWMVKLSEVEPFNGTLAAPKNLMITGGAGSTVRLAEAVFPVPPLVEVTFPVVFR